MLPSAVEAFLYWTNYQLLRWFWGCLKMLNADIVAEFVTSIINHGICFSAASAARCSQICLSSFDSCFHRFEAINTCFAKFVSSLRPCRGWWGCPRCCNVSWTFVESSFATSATLSLLPLVIIHAWSSCWTFFCWFSFQRRIWSKKKRENGAGGYCE